MYKKCYYSQWHGVYKQKKKEKHKIPSNKVSVLKRIYYLLIMNNIALLSNGCKYINYGANYGEIGGGLKYT